MSKKYHLFEVYGIELEYMLVYKNTFKAAPIVDELLSAKAGEQASDVENGAIAWSNELVAHVVELKTNGPSDNLDALSDLFHKNVLEINAILKPLQAHLLPTAAHPLLNPLRDTELWKHSYSEVYELYNRIFNCKGHGWSNVQSTHINLPFYDDKEFEKLHAAIRVVLPLIPGLCASSPILEGKNTGFKDARLEYYKTNQKEIPELTGLVIPERVFTKVDYYATIFEPIKKAIKPHDTNNILDHHFLNSRGAIARFDRNAIEIRLVDIQESPKADMAICVLIIEVLKLLVNKKLAPIQQQKKWLKQELFNVLNPIIKDAENYHISNLDYLNLFLIHETVSVKNLWKHLYGLAKDQIHETHHESIETILNEGTLATRILKAVGTDFTEAKIKNVYSRLADCLQKNTVFLP
ncbi:MAG: glutamate--cysteine ligase [Xanthomarina sp.]|uniref:glutamate-cysteine ligase family protein n=1 Tax=Xanthomarina sp. TaxID=1931211 RepID=UPI000C5454E9|nr:glutamate-cysteine ligase family protein [Xanthomarina sp.]MAL23692.1 glutamate--cysteine ligase [Xanthomarina sp.]MBF60494.1 glutamate--cysteine ligase [Xanthomarina sp.]MDX1316961.1 glutamate-cysteine ligase family protein [Xanthomarina gelatinilytica]